MMKPKSLKIIFVCVFIVLLLGSIQLTKGDIVLRLLNGNEFVAARAPYISFPSNRTYDSGLLTLYVIFDSSNVGNIIYSMYYSLDGKENETVALTEHYRFSLVYRNPPSYYNGSVALPALSNGSHCIIVYVTGFYYNYSDFDSQTVYFTVLSPIALLIENETYNSTEIPLNFYVNGATSQIAYSLDNQANVTINGNTTLTGLTEGTHSITVYSNDTSGNLTNFDFTTFTIAKPSPSPSSYPPISESMLFILMMSLVLAAITILLFLRKRKTAKSTPATTAFRTGSIVYFKKSKHNG